MLFQIVMFSFLRGFSDIYSPDAKNGAFVGFFGLFVGLFLVFACANVRIRAQNEQKMKKNEKK